MFFKKFILVIVLMFGFFSSVFGLTQPVDGWIPVDSSNADSVFLDYFGPDALLSYGTVKVSDDHSPWRNSQHSVQFMVDSGRYAEYFKKEYNRDIGDTSQLFTDIKVLSDSVCFRFYMISEGKLYSSSNIWGTSYTDWRQEMEFHSLIWGASSCLRATRIDILILEVWWETGENPHFPFGGKLDNLAYQTYHNNNKVLLDSMGESQGVEENEKWKNQNEKLEIFPNPFSYSCHFRTSVVGQIAIYDISGKKVKTILKERIWNGKNESGKQLPNGIYFAKTLMGNKTVTTKLTLLK
ncbi:MAG: T9SS type A sorting domain-containing protein [Patescibacteria group bacterium]|nr:T9SS type A sorting domain-containing protein [Patescibacteria group bacterium]MDD5164334.1 T9SS type A sorting domain-containing protein [Patescibacteria group bacterium]MDD5534298.1 T9SS type A sorting domain-containing protein [Patescibacteria group bacterium]